MASVEAVRRLLCGFSVEITPSNYQSIDAAAMKLPKGTEVFIASLPKGVPGAMVDAAVRVRRSGYVPVPHLAARNLASESQFDDLLARLCGEAGVECALVIGGDRDDPLGPYADSLQILRAGYLQKHGVRNVYLSCYPEGHPCIDDERLVAATVEKLAVCEATSLTAAFVSQFCFETAPIRRMTRNLQQQGIRNLLRIGLAGPTGAAALLRYAMLCGVGPSIRALRDRQSLARNVVAGNAEDLLAELAQAQAVEPSLGIARVHFFTFGSLSRTAEMLAHLLSQDHVA